MLGLYNFQSQDANEISSWQSFKKEVYILLFQCITAMHKFSFKIWNWDEESAICHADLQILHIFGLLLEYELSLWVPEIGDTPYSV